MKRNTKPASFELWFISAIVLTSFGTAIVAYASLLTGPH